MQNYGNQRKQTVRKKRPARASTKPAYRIRNCHRPKIHRALFSYKMQKGA